MVSPQVVKRLTRELLQLRQFPPDCVRVDINETDILNFVGWVKGPPGTPYEQGFFQVKFDFEGVDFPASPPRCTLGTKIFHPNVSKSGEICVSTLKKDWSPEYGIGHILVTIKCLLIAPNPDSALDPEAGRLLQEAYDEYCSTAKLWTSIHASKMPVIFAANRNSATPTIKENRAPAPSPLQQSTKQTSGLASSSMDHRAVLLDEVKARVTPVVAPARKVGPGPKRGVRRL
ncbi:hypothetical protein IE53DRAFT_338299 [Violaceomyces palustris]|uniref:Uncharacterized protein n=1 Tax=Violaceomyces palustris TaxID=1673888 RepID=A0ACD0P6T1_9BASI|nr:hypothetical protein IE53DRAFT_338299 [Violaceomyces palustris]